MLESMIPDGGVEGRLASWLNRHRREALDLAALGLSLYLTRRFVAGVPALAALCAIVVAALVPLRAATQPPSLRGEFLAALPRRAASVLATGVLLQFVLGLPLSGLWFGAAWPAIACLLGLDWLGIGNRLRDTGWIHNSVRGEFLRVCLLFLAALWLMRGFARSTLHGASDALWYGLNLADMVAQVRAGVFPVWVGQSIFQFNGALCPIRVAPAFHYLGALVDALTLHRLGTFALQNLLITLLGVGGIFSTYLGLRSLLSDRKWLAAGLAALFLSCPGVLGIAYNLDLYMSWTTLPMVPIVWFATVRSFLDRGRTGTLVLLGAALGLCWWGHSPIALWSTLLAGAAQAARILVQWREGTGWKGALAGALVFAAIAAYPIGSVLLFPPEPGAHIDLFQRATAGAVVDFIRRAFPAAFLPLSANGRSPGDLQLGYSLWAVLLVLAWSRRRSLRPASAVPLAGAALLALLILPIPGISMLLWTAVPAFVRNTTGDWATSRLCIQLAAATVFSAAACASSGPVVIGGRRPLFALLVLFGCVWSFSEADRFAAGSSQSVQPPDSAVDFLRPENIQLTRYSYSMFPHFPGLPGNFTHGVADPELETRLLARDTFARIGANTDAAFAAGHLEAAGEFRWNPDSKSTFADLDQVIRIKPGQRYLLEFDFAQPDNTSGVLEIRGPHLFREYGLPEHGGPRAFGAGGEHAKVVPLSTTAGEEGLLLRFYARTPVAAGQPEPPVAEVKLFSYAREALPVRVDSWIPFRARVRSPAAAWLETPRAFQTGYRAWVDGKPAEVRESPDALVAVAVPGGASEVDLVYEAPAGLKFLFWLSLVAIAGTVSFGIVKWILHLLGARCPAKASEAIRTA
jgi:hypothetical protein